MECRKIVLTIGVVFCVLLVVAEISSLPSYSSEDYDQGVREMLEELQRQGLTGPMVARAYQPSHNMMRKSQRSNNLRLRFGKRSVQPFDSPAVINTKDTNNNNLYWKTVDDSPKVE